MAQNKKTKKKIKDALEELLTSVDIIYNSLEAFGKGEFEVENLCRIRTESYLQERNLTRRKKLRKVERSDDEPGVVNEELKEKLQQWRSERFKADNVPAYTIMHQSTLMEIATYVPKTKKELLVIKGFGDAKFQKYGEEILKITADYSSSV